MGRHAHRAGFAAAWVMFVTAVAGAASCRAPTQITVVHSRDTASNNVPQPLNVVADANFVYYTASAPGSLTGSVGKVAR